MNFVSLKCQVGKSNNLIRTMLAMINQEIDLGTKRQILLKFKKLISKVEKETDFSELMNEMLQGPLSL